MDRQPSGDDRAKAEAVPPKLAAAFAALPRRRIVVPEQVDQTILQAARTHLAQLKPVAQESESEAFLARFLHAWARFAAAIRFSPVLRWSALATALVVLGFLLKSLVVPDHRNTFAAEDVNRDGQVDILDAFALARQINAKQPAPPSLDRNGDGVIDQRDVELIAAHAVSLERKGRL